MIKISSTGTLMVYVTFVLVCFIFLTSVDAFQANVLIDDTARACIANFGLSKLKYNSLSRSTTSKGQSLAGIMHFMAPEMMEGIIAKEGDVYSFGMLIYLVSLGKFIDRV
jgi:hypothetical protein